MKKRGVTAVVLPVPLKATVTAQTKCYISSYLEMVNPEIVAVNIFYTYSTRPPPGDDKIKVLLPINQQLSKEDASYSDLPQFTFLQ